MGDWLQNKSTTLGKSKCQKRDLTNLPSDTALFMVPSRRIYTSHLLGDLQTEGKEGFGGLFSLSIRRTFIMQFELFHYFRIKNGSCIQMG